MASDFAAALAEAIERRAIEDTTSLDEARRARSARTPSMNNPFQPEWGRPPRQANPEKWAPPPYRDREAERLAGRLSKKGKKP